MTARKRLTRAESRALTRARLLEAADGMFQQKGYLRSSVEEVAELAGFSKGAVYSNFRGKPDLFLAVLEARQQREMQKFNDVRRTTESPAQRAQLVGNRYSTLLQQDRRWALASLEFWLEAVRTPRLQTKLAARLREVRENIAQVVAEELPEGVTLPIPAEQLASVLMALSDGLVIQKFADPDAIPDDLYGNVLAIMWVWFSPFGSQPQGRANDEG